MKKTLKNALVITLVTGLCLSLIGIATADDPTYGVIALEPAEPERQSDVTFTVDVTGDNIQEVGLILEECTDEFCHPKINVSMAIVTGDTWGAVKTLDYPDTTIGHCWLVVKSDGIWYDFSQDTSKWTNFTVVPGEDGADGNGADGGDDTDGTPGFELILLVISLVIALSIYKRKIMR